MSMKKHLILCTLLLVISSMVLAQTAANNPAVPINGSYVTITSVDS